MGETHGALCLVDVLAAGAARTKGINLAFAQQVFIGFRQRDRVSWASVHSYTEYSKTKTCYLSIIGAPSLAER